MLRPQSTKVILLGCSAAAVATSIWTTCVAVSHLTALVSALHVAASSMYSHANQVHSCQDSLVTCTTADCPGAYICILCTYDRHQQGIRHMQLRPIKQSCAEDGRTHCIAPRTGTKFDDRPHLQALWSFCPQPQPIDIGPMPCSITFSSIRCLKYNGTTLFCYKAYAVILQQLPRQAATQAAKTTVHVINSV